MTTTLMKRLAACLVGSCAFVAVFAIAMPGSATASCPYNGSYIDCLQDGNSINWCKAHVLNCEEEEEAQAPPCPYDSYTACLQDGKSVDWCKRYVLNCKDRSALYSILLPFTARVCLPGVCWPCVEGEGTITYNGTPEIIGVPVLPACG